MRIIFKHDDWEYDRENLEYLLFEEILRSNSESVFETFSYLSVDFDTVVSLCKPVMLEVGDLDVP